MGGDGCKPEKMKRKDFNSNKEYIEYLIYNKNLLNPKTVILFILIVGTIAITSIGLLSLKNDNYKGHLGEDFTYEYMIEVLRNAGYEESELKKMNEDRIVSLFNQIYLNNRNQNAGKPKYKEYPSSMSGTLKQDYYLLASKGDFKSIVTDFEDKKLEYSFSEVHNKDLITIYNDAYYLNTVINENSQRNDYLTTQVLSNIKDPQMLLYGILLSPEESRRDTIKDKVSISPMLVNNSIRINSVESGSLESASNSAKFKNDYRFKEVARYLYEGDYIIYKFDFTIDGNNLLAYAFKNISDSTTGFYGIYAPPGVTNNYEYLTVYEWIELEKDLSTGYTSNTESESPANDSTTNEATTNNSNQDTGQSSDDSKYTYIDPEEDDSMH